MESDKCASHFICVLYLWSFCFYSFDLSSEMIYQNKQKETEKSEQNSIRHCVKGTKVLCACECFDEHYLNKMWMILFWISQIAYALNDLCPIICHSFVRKAKRSRDISKQRRGEKPTTVTRTTHTLLFRCSVLCCCFFSLSLFCLPFFRVAGIF